MKNNPENSAERERQSFKPHIRVEMDVRHAPNSVSMLLMFGTPEIRRITVPANVPSLSAKVQLAWVRSLIEGFPQTKNGRTYDHLYAPPTGYIYCPRFDEGWVLSRTLALLGKLEVGLKGGGVESLVGSTPASPFSLL